MNTTTMFGGEDENGVNNIGWGGEDPQEFLEEDRGNWGESKKYPIIEVVIPLEGEEVQ